MPQTQEYKFEFTLDKNHPLTFFFEKEDQCEAKISSKLKAEFKAKKKKKLKVSKFLQVVNTSAKLMESIKQIKLDRESTSIQQNYLCCGSGECKL